MAKSPFPGMDPYLESRWNDISLSLMVSMCAALQPNLPAALRARNNSTVHLEDIGEAGELIRGDPCVSDLVIVESHPERDGGGTTVLDRQGVRVDPITITFRTEPIVSRWVQIVDVTDDNRVVTVIEILDPMKKDAGKFNRRYRRKLRDYALGGVSIVEVDLLRSSRRHLEVPQELVPARRRTPYYVGVRRGWSAEEWRLYPLPLQRRLPEVPIPLRRGDAEAWLGLQPLLDNAYKVGAHDDIDYAKPPEPPLTKADAVWSDELLTAAGKR